MSAFGVLAHALLGLLAEGEATGYDLTRRFDVSLANVWTAQHSQIYPELARLTAAGLIRPTGEGARNAKRYALTPAGRDELQRWMRERSRSESLRSERLLRTFFLSALPRDEALAYLGRFEAEEQEQLGAYEALAAELDAAGDTWGRLSLEAGIRISRSLVEWAEWAQQRLRAEPS